MLFGTVELLDGFLAVLLFGFFVGKGFNQVQVFQTLCQVTGEAADASLDVGVGVELSFAHKDSIEDIDRYHNQQGHKQLPVIAAYDTEGAEHIIHQGNGLGGQHDYAGDGSSGIGSDGAKKLFGRAVPVKFRLNCISLSQTAFRALQVERAWQRCSEGRLPRLKSAAADICLRSL